MPTNPKHRVQTSKVSAVYGSVHQDPKVKHPSVDGFVVTPQGIVQAWAYDERSIGFARAYGFHIAMVYDGYHYTMSGPQVYTARGLTTVAARFARDVAAGRYDDAE